ncbi:protein YLS3-like isoform X1 [Olea europaea var. sylvestris]|uniref:protein YLS3-like isoform X1 n=1 Tax=Olea europaea var. sylvestris TaxID=158386 RepID=UPI000C1D2F6F|nr:protein YLS3-like isoform X1 [Olea europaea var. sylvestris]
MPSLSNIVLILLLLLSLSSNTFSQNAGIEQCSSNLLPLAPCAPFVQGAAPLPAQSCCDNLRQLYIQQPSCLCLFLNETTLSSFPINTTLALQLPLICNLQISISTCTGTPLPSTPPISGPKTNSTVAGLHLLFSSFYYAAIYAQRNTYKSFASPMVTVAPRSSIMGFGLNHSVGVKLNPQSQVVMMLLIAILSMFTSILC